MLKEYLEAEGSGILNWALQGLRRLVDRGVFEIPEEVKTAVGEYKTANDVAKLFVEECCECDPSFEMPSFNLYKSFKNWCEENGYKPCASNKASGHWKRLGFTYRRKNDGVYYGGVRVKQRHILASVHN
jgi:putative DNA primase/helicase